jgi:bifunctional non-homologous end joining protein LigD
MARNNSARAGPLAEYRARRDFRATPEPAPGAGAAHKQPIFVVQDHHATAHHFDLRLEIDGVLKSWAVTKEPSLDPAVKRLAVRVEDHPLSYARFEGTIPEGHYGAGEVRIWDRGTFKLVGGGPDLQLDGGKLNFVLRGGKVNGRFSLVRMRGGVKSRRENWLLIKGRDEFAAASSKEAGQRLAASASRRTLTSPPPRVTRRAAAPGEVKITNAHRVVYPDDGVTKGDVVEYYRKIAPRLLPFLRDRPVTLERLPDGLGAGKPHFWQKNTPPTYPDWVPRVTLETGRGKPVAYVLVNDLPTLLYLVNQGTLTFHPWLSRVGDLDRPDFVLFDLDPGPAPFSAVVEVARRIHGMLKAEGHAAVVKTSGKTGLHVLAAWREAGGYDDARSWALALAERVVEEHPKLATVEMRKAARGGRVYIDVLQNARGHHAVPPYVLRAVPGAPVSAPLRWAELRPGLDPKQFNIRTLPARVGRQKADPMAALGD